MWLYLHEEYVNWPSTGNNIIIRKRNTSTIEWNKRNTTRHNIYIDCDQGSPFIQHQQGVEFTVGTYTYTYGVYVCSISTCFYYSGFNLCILENLKVTNLKICLTFNNVYQGGLEHRSPMLCTCAPNTSRSRLVGVDFLSLSHTHSMPACLTAPQPA